MIKSSILFRQILFTIVLLMITGLGVGFTVYELFDDAIIKKERAFLKEETRHQNLPIIAALNTLRNDVQFLSQTPPIQGITHALAAGRVDPQDGSTVEIWQQQVQQIFQAMLQAKSDYLQICYIGIADQGRKIVRVDRKTDSITILDKDELQSKQNEPYFQETLHLGPGEVYLSELNLNKEHGKIVTPHEPVIRAATPVYGPDHTLFGIVIINMGMKPLFNQLQQVDPDNSFYIVNSSGDYLLHPRQEQTFGFEFGKPVRVQDNIPELKIAFNGQIDNLDISLLFEGEDNEEEDKAIHFHKIFFDPQKPGRFLGIINEVSFQELLADTKMVRYQTRGTTALLVLIGMVLAYFITRQLTRPLTQLAISADLVAKGDYQVSLPDNAVGEIRILTNAFKVMIQQIAERSQKLVENENRIKAVLETAVDGILVINEKGIIQSMNSSAKKIFGYAENELVGENVNMLMPSPHREAHDTYLKRYLDTREKRIIDHGREVQGLRKNGAVFPLDIAVSEVKLENIHQFTGIVRDISDRKQVEEDLRKRSQAIEQSGSTIVITDLSGKIEYVNPAFSKITGYSSEEALSQNPRILKSGKHSAAFYKEMWGRLSNGDAWRGELTNKKKSGELYTEYATISPVKDLAGKMTHFVAVKDDISMRKQMELDLINAKELAEQASQTKSDFLANMSHEIRTPMNAILGLTHLCLQTDLTGKQNDYLTKVHSSASALLRIINDILDFSKIEAGKIEMEAVDFNLDDVFEHISNSISTKAQGGELEFLIHSPTDLPKFLVGDPLRLGQILLNLASNAVKFTEQGEVVIYTELRRQEKDRVTLQFTVRDTGIGLDAAQIEKLFQSFSQADSSTTRKFGGTGLGLTIVKQFVEMMNGEIRVESEPGRGSSFIFTAVFGIQAPKKQSEPALLIDLKGMPVLVVDDNATSREIFQKMLESFSFEVTLSASGAEALLQIEKADPPFELVLMDWKMPGLDGIQTSCRIREMIELGLQPKIVLATSFGVEDVARKANNVMIDGFLFKPVTASILYNAILAAFGKDVAQNHRYATLQKIDPEQLRLILGARILLVEDNDINQQIAREILEQAGFVVQIAENGKIAVEQVQKNTYEAVLMDIQMPVMDGYEASLEIRKHPDFKNLPIIAMTADALVTDREKAFKAGMNDHISKPIDLKQLFSSLLKWIEPGAYEINQVNPLRDPDAATGRKIPELAGINTTSGLSRMGRNRDLYLNLLVKFYRDNQQLTAQISQALQEGDQKLADRLVHTIKGVSGNLGALDLQAAAVKLESVIKQEKLPEALKMLESFDIELKTVIEGLKELAEADARTTPPEIEKEEGADAILLGLLQKLESHLQKREPKPSKETIEAINRYRWPETYSNSIDQLAKLISRYNFTDAQQVLIKLTDTIAILKEE